MTVLVQANSKKRSNNFGSKHSKKTHEKG